MRFGDPFLFYSAQRDWGRQATGPLATVGRAWASAVEGAGRLLDSGLWADPTLGNLANHLAGAVNFINLAFFVFAVVVLIAGSRDLPPSLTLYGLLLIAPATLFGTPQSSADGHPTLRTRRVPHLYRARPPSRNKLLFGGWLVLSALASLLLCALFVSWRFIA